MFRNQYDNDITTWSPQGRLLQVEYATEAVKQGSICLGLRNQNFVVLLALKRSPGTLASYQKKILSIDKHCGIGISGLTSDARVLNSFMRTESLNERLTYDRGISVYRLATLVADKAQVNTQHYGGRPYGVGLLLAGFDETGPHLYEISPSAQYYEYYAMAIGARSQPARTYFEKNYQDFMNTTELGALVMHGLNGLWESLPNPSDTKVEPLNPSNTTIAVVGLDTSFRELDAEELQNYLNIFYEAKRNKIVIERTEETPVESSSGAL